MTLVDLLFLGAVPLSALPYLLCSFSCFYPKITNSNRSFLCGFRLDFPTFICNILPSGSLAATESLYITVQVGPAAVSLALKAFSQIDGLIINHGTLSPIKRVVDSTPEEWRAAFDVNFFSAIAFVSPLKYPRVKLLMPSSAALLCVGLSDLRSIQTRGHDKRALVEFHCQDINHILTM